MKRRKLEPARMVHVDGQLVEATPINLMLGYIDSWWAVLFGWVAAGGLALLLLAIFGVIVR